MQRTETDRYLTHEKKFLKRGRGEKEREKDVVFFSVCPIPNF